MAKKLAKVSILSVSILLVVVVHGFYFVGFYFVGWARGGGGAPPPPSLPLRMGGGTGPADPAQPGPTTRPVPTIPDPKHATRPSWVGWGL